MRRNKRQNAADGSRLVPVTATAKKRIDDKNQGRKKRGLDETGQNINDFIS